jgi:hypothetical protein
MLMRYHWGLAVGHLYSHDRPANMTEYTLDLELSECAALELPLHHNGTNCITADFNTANTSKEVNSDIIQEELDIQNCEDDQWENLSSDEDEQMEESDDDILMASDDIYI